MCVICEDKYPYSMDAFIYVYSYQSGYDITSNCCYDCIHEKYNTNCYKCDCSFTDPYHKIYVNKQKVYCNSCYSDVKRMNEYMSMKSIKSLKDCVQANIFKHIIDNKILSHDLKTNYQKIQQLYESKNITMQIKEQLHQQIEKYHIKNFLFTPSNKVEEMTFNRILEKMHKQNSNIKGNAPEKSKYGVVQSKYDVDQEFKIAIKYFPEYVDCDFHCAQELSTFLIRIHRNDLLKYIFEYDIHISINGQYYKYVEAIYYNNESAIPILLEKNFNFIKLKKHKKTLVKNYHQIVESVIQYFIDENKKNILNLLINNINKIKKLYNIKDEDIDPQEIDLIKSINNNSNYSN